MIVVGSGAACAGPASASKEDLSSNADGPRGYSLEEALGGVLVASSCLSALYSRLSEWLREWDAGFAAVNGDSGEFTFASSLRESASLIAPQLVVLQEQLPVVGAAAAEVEGKGGLFGGIFGRQISPADLERMEEVEALTTDALDQSVRLRDLLIQQATSFDPAGASLLRDRLRQVIDKVDTIVARLPDGKMRDKVKAATSPWCP